MKDYVAFTEFCATCEHWTGERRPEPAEGRIYTSRHAAIGTCSCPHGHWKGRLKPAESNCPHWARWSVMKDHDPPPPIDPLAPYL